MTTMLLMHKQRMLIARTSFTRLTRFVTKETKTWERRYKRTTRIELEKYWRKRLSDKWENRTLTSVADSDKPKFYCLSMFPYPSGRLHMGHVRVYTISDTFAHFFRMNGYNVIHPMGWDAFGLPAENAARERGLNPKEWTESNISYMRDQLRDLNLTFDWEKEFSTCDPDYYKWTQYIFLKLFKAGLAYRKEALVNWDPVDQTVLANEQVNENGCSWRSGAKVEEKYLKQWFFKTSEYAESLLNTLNEIDENYGIKAMQRNWIGKIDGCYFDLPLEMTEGKTFSLPFFCTHPEAIYKASHVVIQSKYKEEIARQFAHHGAKNLSNQLSKATDNQDTLLDGCLVNNPLSNKVLPILVSNKFESTLERPSAIICIPSVDEAAKLMAHEQCIDYSSESNVHTGNRDVVLPEAKRLGISTGKMTASKLCDWLISRQRYWGTPIPIIHCPKHGPVAVQAEELPVTLPHIKDLCDSTGISPLESVGHWVNTTCPKCGAPSKRETDTMDTFVDSSWYFLRYTDPSNSGVPFSKDFADRTMPVDLYIGGKEHATLHLYYARFFSHFLVDQGLHSHREPFKKLLAQGIIKGLTHQVKSTGKYIPASAVDKSGAKPVTNDTGEEVEESFQKMSKSKLNGIDPEDFVNEWGINITRLYVLYAAAPFEDIHWDVKTDVIPGVMRWQLKVWTCVTKILDARNKVEESDVKSKKMNLELLQEVDKIRDNINKAITDVTNHYTKDSVLSAAITCLMTLVKSLYNASDEVISYSPEFERGVCALIIMSAPMVPHLSSELWTGLQLMPYKLTEQNWDEDVLQQKWPQPKLDNSLNLREYKVRVNNKICYAIKLPDDLDDMSEVKSTLLTYKKVSKRLKGAVPNDISIDKENCVINISATMK